MTKEQARNLLADVTWLLQLKRQEHESIVNALELLKPVEETDKKKEKWEQK